MRMFSNKEISIDYIEQIIQIANKAPSACNRQPAKVYFVKDKDKVNSVDFLITGNHGFEGKIPCYAILAEDRAYFTGEEEFQWYINGGIYLSYLTLAIQHSIVAALFIGNDFESRRQNYDPENGRSGRSCSL